MALRGQTVGTLEATDFARVQIGDNYYGRESQQEQSWSETLRWLNPPVSTASSPDHREPGTCLWFCDTEYFRSWHEGEDAHMLVHGMVGCGKTVLATTIVQKCIELKTPTDRVMAFYFSSTVNEQLDLSSLRYLVAQLCEPKRLPRPLRELYEEHHRAYPATTPSNTELEKLVSTLLCSPHDRLYEDASANITSLQCAYLVIDGLDEIRDRGKRRAVVQCFNRLVAAKLRNFRVLITSRPEADITSTLNADRGWTELAIPKNSVRADIEIYVRNALLRHEELK